MDLTAVPKLCKESLCIAGNPIIAAIISSYFNVEGEYFCVLEPPRMNRPDYLNEITKRNNVGAKLKPRKIILAELEDRALSVFQRYFPSEITTIIKSSSELEDRLGEIKTFHFDGEIFCNLKEISYGLLLAKRMKMKLTVDVSAPSLEEKFRELFYRSNHLIAVEDSDDFAPIIAANYAFSLNANLELIPKVNDQDIDKVYDELIDRQVFRLSPRGEKAEINLTERSVKYKAQIPALKLDFITFITLGIPYGYFFPEVPSAHLFSYPDLGFNIFAGIYYASEIKNTRSAVLVDPGFFKNSESDIVIQNLQSKRVFIKSLRGDEAKVYAVNNHIQFYPYDLLYICSHAGEMEGKRLKIRFYDLHGKPHIIVIDHATGFGLTEEGKGADTIVEVTGFRRFVELDGVVWTDKERLERIENFKHVIKTFAEIPIEKWEILESRDVPYVKDCFALKLTDHYCLILFHVVADHELPIVFNNACVSFYSSSGRFIFAGARAYIGTLTKIENESAISVAKNLFKNLTDEKPLPVVLWEAQRFVWPDDPQSRTYIYIGCHFSNIVDNDKDMSTYLKSRLKEGLHRWIKGLNELEVKEQINETKYPDIKRNMAKAIKFIAAQIDELKFNTD